MREDRRSPCARHRRYLQAGFVRSAPQYRLVKVEQNGIYPPKAAFRARLQGKKQQRRDPTPTPASPHRRFAPQLLRPPSLRSPIAPSSRLPRNCLEGRGKATGRRPQVGNAATAGKVNAGQLLCCCLNFSIISGVDFPQLVYYIFHN